MFDFVDGQTRNETHNLYTDNELKRIGVDDLRKEFEASDGKQLRRSFGDFETYLSYMTERTRTN